MKAPLEKDILKQCLQWLSLKRVFHWRNNSGMVIGEYKGKRHVARFGGKKGASDIFLLLPGGRFAAVEVKRPGGEPTEQQTTFLDDVVQAGGFSCCVHSVDELIEVVSPLLESVNRRGGQ